MSPARQSPAWMVSASVSHETTDTADYSPFENAEKRTGTKEILDSQPADYSPSEVTERRPSTSDNIVDVMVKPIQPHAVAKEATNQSHNVAKEGPSKPVQSSLLLDNCLARAARLMQKLDKLSGKAAQGEAKQPEEAERSWLVSKSEGRTGHSTNQPERPAVLLDHCLSRANSLHKKLDCLSSKVQRQTEMAQYTHRGDGSNPAELEGTMSSKPCQLPGQAASQECL